MVQIRALGRPLSRDDASCLVEFTFWMHRSDVAVKRIACRRHVSTYTSYSRELLPVQQAGSYSRLLPRATPDVQSWAPFLPGGPGGGPRLSSPCTNSSSHTFRSNHAQDIPGPRLGPAQTSMPRPVLIQATGPQSGDWEARWARRRAVLQKFYDNPRYKPAYEVVRDSGLLPAELEIEVYTGNHHWWRCYATWRDWILWRASVLEGNSV